MAGGTAGRRRGRLTAALRGQPASEQVAPFALARIVRSGGRGHPRALAREYMSGYTTRYITNRTPPVGKPLMLREEDDRRIERLKTRLGAPSKVAVVRSALDLLEARAIRAEQVVRWRRAARLAAASSLEVLRDFQPHSRLRRDD